MTRTSAAVLSLVAATIVSAGCAHVIGGTPALPATVTSHHNHTVDVDSVLLTTPELRGLTGAGPELTKVPGMDATTPVDEDNLVQLAPPECQFVFRESLIFGPDIDQFHKTGFQAPPRAALLTEGAAVYADADTARRAFDNVANMVMTCGNTTFASMFVGQWTADDTTLRTRTVGSCGRVYRIESAVLIEVTYCGYPAAVPEEVAKQMAAKVAPR
ncbi:MAG: sensor domain-containing protein [Mycobacteriaceae bacterium]|nr:sensor domain-containing protein [Mycobacteriaceae bacterium]